MNSIAIWSVFDEELLCIAAQQNPVELEALNQSLQDLLVGIEV